MLNRLIARHERLVPSKLIYISVAVEAPRLFVARRLLAGAPAHSSTLLSCEDDLPHNEEAAPTPPQLSQDTTSPRAALSTPRRVWSEAWTTR